MTNAFSAALRLTVSMVLLGAHPIKESSHRRALLLFSCAVLGITCNVFAQEVHGYMNNEARQFVGTWSGTRTERNPITGRAFTINFEVEFRGDGTYTERAGFGRATILQVEGRFSARRAAKPGDPSVTHILSLAPENIVHSPSSEELNALQVADLPNVERTEQYAFFYNLAPRGALTLQDTRPGAETWGLHRLS